MSQRIYKILTTLRNEHLTLTVHTDGTWSLHTRIGPPARLSRIHWSAHVHPSSSDQNVLLSSLRLRLQQMDEEEIPTPLGPAHVVTLTHGPSREGLELLWRAYVFQKRPYIAVAVGVRSVEIPWRVRRLTPLVVEPPRGHVLMDGVGPRWMFFVEGWHSWSFSGVLADNQRQPRPRWPRLDAAMAYDIAHPPPREPGHFLSHTLAALTGLAPEPSTLVLAWLRQHRFLGLVEIQKTPGPDPNLWGWMDAEHVLLSPHSPLWSEPLLVHIVPPRTPNPLGKAVEALRDWNQIRPRTTSPVIWNSWCAYGRHVSPTHLAENTHYLAQKRDILPVDVIQLDAGYEEHLGDWLRPRPPFAEQMADLARRIENEGFQPGIWVAPFIAEAGSEWARAHPDLFIRDETGHPAKAGFVRHRFVHPLDVTHPRVQEHIREVIHTLVHTWGYRLLKLDFLYAAAFPGQRHATELTRVEAYRKALELVREAAGEDTFLLAGGAPLGPSIGLVDAIRVGPNVAPHWHPKRLLIQRPWKRQPTYPAMINAIRNTLTRSMYHRHLWWNVPDCLITRDRHTALQDHEIQSWLTVVGLGGGMIVFGDPMPQLPPERVAWTAFLLPVQPERAIPLDVLEHTPPETFVLRLERTWGRGVTVGLFNWRDELRTRTLQLGTLGLDWHQPHHVLDFWHKRYYRVIEGYRVFTNIPPHGGHLLGIKPVLDIPHLAGSTFHISQGGEIEEWHWEPPHLTFRVNLGRRARGTVLLGLANHRITTLPSDIQVEEVTDDVVGLTFNVAGERTVHVKLMRGEA